MLTHHKRKYLVSQSEIKKFRREQQNQYNQIIHTSLLNDINFIYYSSDSSIEILRIFSQT